MIYNTQQEYNTKEHKIIYYNDSPHVSQVAKEQSEKFHRPFAFAWVNDILQGKEKVITRDG